MAGHHLVHDLKAVSGFHKIVLHLTSLLRVISPSFAVSSRWILWVKSVKSRSFLLNPPFISMRFYDVRNCSPSTSYHNLPWKIGNITVKTIHKSWIFIYFHRFSYMFMDFHMFSMTFPRHFRWTCHISSASPRVPPSRPAARQGRRRRRHRRLRLPEVALSEDPHF